MMPKNTSENVINHEQSSQKDKTVSVYESNTEKGKKIVSYIMLGLSVIVNAILIWKR